MPDVRRWLESLRSSLRTAVCAHRRDRCNGLALAHSHRLPRIVIVRFVIDSRLESSGRGKCSDDRTKKTVWGTDGDESRSSRTRRMGGKYRSGARTPRCRFSQVSRSFRASLLETNARNGQKAPWLNDPPSPVRTDNERPARG